MSHIPSSAMKHAGPVHHEDETPSAPTPSAAKDGADAGTDESAGIGTGAWIAIGGTLLAGAAAAVAVPLLRGRRTPVPTRRGKKATTKSSKAAKGKAGKTAEA